MEIFGFFCDLDYGVADIRILQIEINFEMISKRLDEVRQ